MVLEPSRREIVRRSSGWKAAKRVRWMLSTGLLNGRVWKAVFWSPETLELVRLVRSRMMEESSGMLRLNP